MRRAGFVAGGAMAALLWTAAVEAGDLNSAKAQYAAANYEEALAALATVDANESVEQVNQLRALCLLALGRTSDAEQAVSRIVLHNPVYRLEPNEVSPKLVAVFHEVRRKLLPDAARRLYATAKSRYDEKQWSQASDGFTKLLALLSDPDAASQQAALTDLRQLGEGFLKLSDAEVAAEAKRQEEATAKLAAEKAAAEKAAAEELARAEAAARQAAAQVAQALAAPPGGAAPAVPVYSATDRDVTPPVELRRVMPRWIPPTPAMALVAHTGLLELIIDETGAVAEATISKTISPAYDQALRESARSWRYRPARRGTQAVRYRQVLEIVLRPAQPPQQQQQQQ